ncbi:uncharacterized protein BXZ73DRAFT_44506, partial [Epithele typhae]|uniref:uncharacterized protein n=1 Tax=Epithele typhae TaxID=378194 RepID=UPI002008CA94
QGWKSENLENAYKKRRAVVKQPKAQANSEYFWFKQMKTVMSEIDSFEVGLIPPSGEVKFLDIGCAPGGFSSYILAKNSQAQGTGVTLDTAQGGYRLLLEERYQRRYTLVIQDLLQLDFTHDSEPPPVPLAPIPPSLRDHQYSLVIIDGHHLRDYRPAEPLVHAPDAPALSYLVFRDAFFLSQLLLALGALGPGGTLVVKLAHVDFPHTAQTLFLLDALAERRLALCKPRGWHAARGTFYAVARGVRVDRARPEWLARLRALWWEVRFGGEGEGMGRAMRAGELEFVASPETIVGEWLDRLVELALPVWAGQVDGMREMFEQKGVR